MNKQEIINYLYNRNVYADVTIEELAEVLAVKPRPKGEWIVKSNGTTNHYACDKCGSAGDIQDKFCRECGVRMMKGGKK